MIRVLITFWLRPDLVERIRLIAPDRVTVRLLTDKESHLAFPSEREREALGSSDFLSALTQTEIVFGFWTETLQGALTRTGSLRSTAPYLRWVQLTRAGIDHIALDFLESAGISLTTASGMHAVPISEFVLLAMLFFSKNAPRFLTAQHNREWIRYSPRELSGQTVGIVGLGRIGSHIARTCKALGCRVLATRRTPIAPPEYVDGLLPPEGLPELLKSSDFLVLAVPLTPSTQGLIGDQQFRLMKPSAVIINIARGPVVVERALVEALHSKTIAGAALDVFDHEPLPQSSDLWHCPNVVVTPHIAGGTDRYDERAVDIFLENLQRYLKGERLLNIADKDAGY